MGQGQLYEFQQGQIPGPVLQSKQPHAMLQVWGRVAGNMPGGKGPGSVDRQAAEHEPAVCAGAQDVQWLPGLCEE